MSRDPLWFPPWSTQDYLIGLGDLCRSIDSYSGNSLNLVEIEVATGALRVGRMLVYNSNCIKVRKVLCLLSLESHHLLQQAPEDFIHILPPSSTASSSDR